MRFIWAISSFFYLRQTMQMADWLFWCKTSPCKKYAILIFVLIPKVVLNFALQWFVFQFLIRWSTIDPTVLIADSLTFILVLQVTSSVEDVTKLLPREKISVRFFQ